MTNPEIGTELITGALVTNLHDVGDGEPVLLLHGSGPGVSAWANWRFTIRDLGEKYRLIAPDLAGFGFTTVPDDIEYSLDTWLSQIIAVLDGLDIERANVVGNSFGGSMALALAIHHPERVKKLVCMGSVGVPFVLTEGLDAVWGYKPSVENMKAIMRYFAYDQSLLGDELAQMRFEASNRPGVQEKFAAMFPAPRQRWVDALAHADDELRSITAPTLLVHGRDDQVIPMTTSLTLLELIDDAQLHVFGRCGHWTQIEHADEFAVLLDAFFARP